ncbi:MAG: hypothetical protein JWP03_440 [Phycisphaerales bacterium]|nr:hypothetical protein [Phycisphaerales bacterium]
MSHRNVKQPHTSPADYNEGPQAASRFRNALGHLASVPPASVPRAHPEPRSKSKRKK